jgi:hypothetical protein
VFGDEPSTAVMLGCEIVMALLAVFSALACESRPSAALQTGGSGARLARRGRNDMKKVLFASIALVAMSGIASAGETLKFHIVVHAAEPARVHQIGDVEGHRVLLVHNVGTVTFEDGSTGTTDQFGAGDYHNAYGQFPLFYAGITAADGSTLWLQGPLDSAPTTTGRTSLRATMTVISGTGRFAGLKGEGTAIGERPASGVTGDSVGDFVINLSDTGLGTAEEAKAMLARVIAAVKADRDVALAQFLKGEAGFKDRDLYPFCSRVDGTGLAGPVAILAGANTLMLKDPNGKMFGKEQFDVALKNPEGSINEVSQYLLPRPGTTGPAVPKRAFVTHVGDLVCGVGYYPN